MKLSNYIVNERKQVLNREWKYLNPIQRNVIFLRFLLGSISHIAYTALTHLIERQQILFDQLLYPAHWL